jgi:flagellar basal body-associated protein FliL
MGTRAEGSRRSTRLLVVGIIVAVAALALVAAMAYFLFRPTNDDTVTQGPYPAASAIGH